MCGNDDAAAMAHEDTPSPGRNRLLILYGAPGMALSVAAALAETAGSSAEATVLATQAAVAGFACTGATFPKILSLAILAGYHSRDILSQLRGLLTPGGVLTLVEPGAEIVALTRDLLLAGFADAAPQTVPDALAALYRGTVVGPGPAVPPPALTILRTALPAWAPGASAVLRAPLKRTVAVPAAAVVTLSLGAPDSDDLVDEDDLLGAPPAGVVTIDAGRQPAPVDGAAGPVKKACKNCTCGRAEGAMDTEATATRVGLSAAGVDVRNPSLTAAQVANPQSACGSCGLGDAFRCGGCPYRGLPPFPLGQRIELSASLLSADA